jgi:hypothetical protein
VFSVEFGAKPGSSFHADKASLMTRFWLVRHFSMARICFGPGEVGSGGLPISEVVSSNNVEAKTPTLWQKLSARDGALAVGSDRLDFHGFRLLPVERSLTQMCGDHLLHLRH